MLDQGLLCRVHNSMFSGFESIVLTGTVFGMERARLAQETKKGRPGMMQMKGLDISGDTQFRRHQVSLNRINTNFIKNFDPATGTLTLMVPGFDDKSSAAISRLLLKMGIEGIAQSRRMLYAQTDFTALREFLIKTSTEPWPFLSTKIQHHQFSSLPTQTVKYKLSLIPCRLLVAEVDKNTLLLNFRYGGLSFVINLLNREFHWMSPYMQMAAHGELYPISIRGQFK